MTETQANIKASKEKTVPQDLVEFSSQADSWVRDYFKENGIYVPNDPKTQIRVELVETLPEEPREDGVVEILNYSGVEDDDLRNYLIAKDIAMEQYQHTSDLLRSSDRSVGVGAKGLFSSVDTGKVPTIKEGSILDVGMDELFSLRHDNHAGKKFVEGKKKHDILVGLISVKTGVLPKDVLITGSDEIDLDSVQTLEGISWKAKEEIGASDLVSYLQNELPDDGVKLFERARILGGVDELKMKMEEVFGVGAYEEVLYATSGDVLKTIILLELRKRRKILGEEMAISTLFYEHNYDGREVYGARKRMGTDRTSARGKEGKKKWQSTKQKPKTESFPDDSESTTDNSYYSQKTGKPYGFQSEWTTVDAHSILGTNPSMTEQEITKAWREQVVENKNGMMHKAGEAETDVLQTLNWAKDRVFEDLKA